ncbi:hypothetical protein V6N13_137567 [Hibiscus sabdariffa]
MTEWMVIAGFRFWAFPPAILSLVGFSFGKRGVEKQVSMLHFFSDASAKMAFLLRAAPTPTYVSWTQIIDVVSSAFEGQSAVNRQRMVYKAIWEELQNAVDQMTTQTPNEAASQKWKAFSPIFPTLKPHSFQ